MRRAARLFALAMAIALAPTAVRAQDDELAAEDQAPSEASASDPQPSDQAVEQPTADAEQAPAEASGTSEVSAPTLEAAPSPERALSLYAGAGLGVGTLAFQRPTAQGAQRLAQTEFAAAEFLLRVHAWQGRPLSLEVLLAYQTSLGLVLQTAPLFGLPQNVDVRAQRVELCAAPWVRLGNTPNAPALAFPLGFAFHSLFPGVHQFDMPKYSVGGPQLRAEVMVALGEFVSLRAGPEAQWLLLIDPSLRREGACCQGFAFGGQGSLQASVGPGVRIALAYRESHAFVPSGSWMFMDVQRFLTARIAGEL
jgi:hypothetical protein